MCHQEITREDTDKNMRKQGFDKLRQGQRIDNIPSTGTMTGNYEVDYYGCWWEVVPDKKGRNFWMIGEYPYKY